MKRALVVLLLLTACGRLHFEDLRERTDGIDASTEDGGQLDASELDADEADAGTDDGALNDAALDAVADVGALPDVDQPDATMTANACPPGLTGPTCEQCVRYVDASGTSTNPDGLTWQSADKDIIQGLGRVVNRPGGAASCQLWVREGRYRTYVDGPAGYIIPFPANAIMYGGFAGTELQLWQRDFRAHPSVIDAADDTGQNHAWHAISAYGGGLIDGFTIRGGLANGGNIQHSHGGAMLIAGGTMRLRNMLFQSNGTTGDGGALFVENSNLIIEDSVFRNNQADGSGAAIALGGGMLGFTLSRVEIRGNTAGGDGGGIFSALGSPTDAPVSLSNVVIAGNTAGGRGGGAYMRNMQGTIVATTIAGNQSGSGPSGLDLTCAVSCSVVNSILWNPSTRPDMSRGTAVVRNSVVRGGTTGTAVLTTDPAFVAFPNDLHLSAASPAIDAADGCAGPERDFDDRGRMDAPGASNSGVAPVFSDIGAFEYQVGGTPYAFSALCP